MQDNLYEVSAEDNVMFGYFIEGIVMAFLVGGLLGTMVGMQLRNKQLRPATHETSRRN